jgi:2-polyprenyl-3-methyl-5-hydroxy-6-metoxy-1,4-benzoquinol methylase
MEELSWFRDRMYGSYVSSGQAKRVQSADAEIVFSKAKNFANYVIKRFVSVMPKNISVLDVACGSGPYIYYLKQNGYTNIQGVDISEEQVKLAHDLTLKEIICDDIFNFLSNNKGKYDLILLMDIIEHLTKPELLKLLDLVNESLNDKGKIIIHIPNAEGIFGMRVRYGDVTHEQSFTPFSMKQILSVANFENVKSFEDKPVMHSAVAVCRRIMWQVLTFPLRLLFFAETASFSPIFTQNMTVTASKK